MTEEDSEERGDVFSLTVIKNDTRLIISYHERKCSTKDAIKLFSEVKKTRNSSAPIPVFISNDWDAVPHLEFKGVINILVFFQ